MARVEQLLHHLVPVQVRLEEALGELHVRRSQVFLAEQLGFSLLPVGVQVVLAQLTLHINEPHEAEERCDGEVRHRALRDLLEGDSGDKPKSIPHIQEQDHAHKILEDGALLLQEHHAEVVVDSDRHSGSQLLDDEQPV